MCKAGVKQDPQEEEQSKPPARSAKTLSSFFGEHLSPLVPLGCAASRLQTLFRQCWLDKAWKVGLSGVRTLYSLSSLAAPRKPAVKAEVKQEESSTPRKEETKG